MEQFELKVEIHGHFGTYSDSEEEVKGFIESTWLNDGIEKIQSLLGSKVEGNVTKVEEAPECSISSKDGLEGTIPFDIDFVIRTTLSSLAYNQEQAKKVLAIILECLQGEIEDILAVGITIYVEGTDITELVNEQLSLIK